MQTKEMTAAPTVVPIGTPIKIKIDQMAEESREGGTDLGKKRIFAFQYRISIKHWVSKSAGVVLPKDYLKSDRTISNNDRVEEADITNPEIVLDDDMLVDHQVDEADRLFDVYKRLLAPTKFPSMYIVIIMTYGRDAGIQNQYVIALSSFQPSHVCQTFSCFPTYFLCLAQYRYVASKL
jgi:hypothetical protein